MAVLFFCVSVSKIFVQNVAQRSSGSNPRSLEAIANYRKAQKGTNNMDVQKV